MTKEESDGLVNSKQHMVKNPVSFEGALWNFYSIESRKMTDDFYVVIIELTNPPSSGISVRCAHLDDFDWNFKV